MTQILIIEDEERIASFISKGLKTAGFATAVAATGLDGIQMATTSEISLIILDLGLPDQDGFSVLRTLRSRRINIPIIILTARSSLGDTVAGLEGGADDYMSKPFRFEELLARVRLRLKGANTADSPVRLTCGGLVLDTRTRRAEVASRTIELSAKEFALAETLMRHPDQVLSREQLLDQVWGYAYDPGSNVVDVYVGYLRRKLGAERIETVRGMGYRLINLP